MRIALISCCWVVVGCVSLNSAGMAPQCRDLYNACLNRCPQPPARVEGTTLDSLSKAPVGNSLDTATPRCTQKCNDEAKQCK